MWKTIELLIFTLLAFATLPFASASPDSGTLIVTYHSENPQMPLDRVRFWLMDDQQQRRLYPQGDHYIDDAKDGSRMVLIENLPLGNYTVEFVVPNKNQAYRTTPRKELTISAGSVIKIDQAVGIQTQPTASDASTIALIQRNVYYERPDSVIILPKTGQRIYSYPSSQTMPEEDLSSLPQSAIAIKSNLANGHWRLYHYDQEILSGQGSHGPMHVVPGDGYRVEADNFDDFNVRVFPNNDFYVHEGQLFTVEITYRKKLGFLEMALEIPTGEQVEISLEGSSLPHPLDLNLTSVQNVILWRSKPLPPGNYLLKINPPNIYTPMDPIPIEIKKDQKTSIAPKLIGNRTIHVKSNTDQAIYLLRSESGTKAWKGEGRNFSFHGLIPGSYTLTYTSSSPQKEIAPPSKKVTLSPNSNREISVEAVYSIPGELQIKSNVKDYHVRIDDLNNKLPSTKENITNYTQTLDLPAGKYRISFLPLPGQSNSQAPRPMLVTITSNKKSEASAEYSSETDTTNTPHPKEEIKIPSPTETLLHIETTQSILGDPFNDNKTNDLPPKKISLKAFNIGTYEVTNGQYARWLTEAHQEKKILYHDTGKNRGIITNPAGEILFKTTQADDLSQIDVLKESDGTLLFLPTAGKSDHPVIFVSWFGAQQFCLDHGCRLPTEAEWETAAGIVPQQEPIVKFRYGFSKNEISPTWANYKKSDLPITHQRVLSTPVGFYNGTNLLPLNTQSTEQPQTNLAKSPVGAYDMSGNVWEWTSDWWYTAEALAQMTAENPKGPDEGDKKIAKGGCYDSLADGVRVAERIGIPPDNTDAFTGFRVAQDQDPPPL